MGDFNAPRPQHAFDVRAFKHRIERPGVKTGGRDGAVRDIARRIARDGEIAAHHAQRAAAAPGA